MLFSLVHHNTEQPDQCYNIYEVQLNYLYWICKMNVITWIMAYYDYTIVILLISCIRLKLNKCNTPRLFKLIDIIVFRANML